MEEIKALLQEVRDQGHFWYPVWVVALNTGMRSGELYALRWDHIDLEKNIITCHESFNFFIKSIGPTKGRYWRTIPISERLREFLVEHKASKKQVSFLIGLKLGIMESKLFILKNFADIFLSLQLSFIH